MLRDSYDRRIRYLRVSLTDNCNLRCVYCVPDRHPIRPARNLLTNEELLRLLRIFARLGIAKIRFTGGEPTLRDSLPALIQQTLAMPGVEEVGLTSNAVLLEELARPLVHAGLQRININLNTRQPRRFKTMTRGGRLDDAWKGILACDREGLAIKINSVIVRGYNDGEDPVDLARLTLQYPWQVRFIELMPLGDVGEFQLKHVVREDELRQKLGRELGPLLPAPHAPGVNGYGPIYRFASAPGTVRFISSHSQPFCEHCTRVRLTADGRLRLCLLQDAEVDLLAPLRQGAEDRALAALIRKGVAAKPVSHGLQECRMPVSRLMSEIGG